MAQDPFPLYPGEVLQKPKTALTVVHVNAALRLRAILDFTDNEGNYVIAGDEWLFEGPGTYMPKKEVEVIQTVLAVVVKPNQAIKLRARKETKVIQYFVSLFCVLFSIIDLKHFGKGYL